MLKRKATLLKTNMLTVVARLQNCKQWVIKWIVATTCAGRTSVSFPVFVFAHTPGVEFGTTLMEWKWFNPLFTSITPNTRPLTSSQKTFMELMMTMISRNSCGVVRNKKYRKLRLLAHLPLPFDQHCCGTFPKVSIFLIPVIPPPPLPSLDIGPSAYKLTQNSVSPLAIFRSPFAVRRSPRNPEFRAAPH